MNGGGKVVASGSEEHEPFVSLGPGWAEQRPQDWWRACGSAVRKALNSSELRGDEITGVGFSGQMHGAVLLDSSDEVVRSAIIWCDQRSEAQSNELSELFGRGHEVEIVAAEEGPAYGAAILAGIGAAHGIPSTKPAIAWSELRPALLPIKRPQKRCSTLIVRTASCIPRLKRNCHPDWSAPLRKEGQPKWRDPAVSYAGNVSNLLRGFFHDHHPVATHIPHLLHNSRRPSNLNQVRRRIRSQPEMHRPCARRRIPSARRHVVILRAGNGKYTESARTDHQCASEK